MTPGNKIAKAFIEIIYMIIPLMLIFAPFYQGEYSYYNILRLFTFLFSGYFMVITLNDQDGYYANRSSKYPIMFGIIAIVFNPIIPLHLSREIWAPIDILAGVAIIIYFIERKIYHKANKKIAEQQKEIDRKQDEEYLRIKNRKWCKNCQFYKRNIKYEDSIHGLWKSIERPDTALLPCKIAQKARMEWEKYYNTADGKRTLYPKNCSYWIHK